MTKSPNIIQRRELDPLLLKARKIVKYYEKAAECSVAVLGPDCDMQDESPDPRRTCFCGLRGQFCPYGSSQSADDEYPCASLHRGAVTKARRLGGSYIYLCPAGFIFWTSPIYAGERFAGALVSGGVLGIEKQQAALNIFQSCGGKAPIEEIMRSLEKIPEKTSAEVKALAQMMLICADQISGIGSLPGSETPEPAVKETRSPPANVFGGENCYPLDKERMLLASLRRGDNAQARNILKELLEILYAMAGGSFGIFQLRAIELAVLLSRAVSRPEDIEDAETIEANNRYLKKIEDARSVAEITDILTLSLNRMSGKIFSFQGIRHSSALRKAERFIWDNYTRKISLQEIASASGLSAPYFSTIFKDEMGENLSNYLNRLRVEKAIAMLSETDLPISGIATACGFEDQSWFSKIFKAYTGISPGKYREQGGMLN
jgi:AraC-like DNA-binding protein/ligand-binding sensor protein